MGISPPYNQPIKYADERNPSRPSPLSFVPRLLAVPQTLTLTVGSRSRDGVGVGDMRRARGGGRAAPHAGAAGVDRGEGAPERAARGGGAVRGAVPLGGARAAEDEVPPLPPQAHEHQALPRPHPLPRPREDPLAHYPRVTTTSNLSFVGYMLLYLFFDRFLYFLICTCWIEIERREKSKQKRSFFNSRSPSFSFSPLVLTRL